MKKKGLIIAAVVLVLGGIGVIMNKNEEKRAAELPVTVVENVPTAKPQQTAAPTQTPEVLTLESAAPTASSAPVRSAEHTYIINISSGKFHFDWCSSVEKIKDSNRQEFTGSREDLIEMGYEPCGNCKP